MVSWEAPRDFTQMYILKRLTVLKHIQLAQEKTSLFLFEWASGLLMFKNK